MAKKKDHTKKKLKNKLPQLRKGKGITQKQLAEELGLTRQSIISIEKGDCTPSLCHALKIAHYFNMKVEEIFELA